LILQCSMNKTDSSRLRITSVILSKAWKSYETRYSHVTVSTHDVSAAPIAALLLNNIWNIDMSCDYILYIYDDVLKVYSCVRKIFYQIISENSRFTILFARYFLINRRCLLSKYIMSVNIGSCLFVLDALLVLSATTSEIWSVH